MNEQTLSELQNRRHKRALQIIKLMMVSILSM